MKVLLPLLLFITTNLWAANCQFELGAPPILIQLQETSVVTQKSIAVYRGSSNPLLQCYAYRIYFSKGAANNYQRKAYNSTGQSITYNLHESANLSGVLKDYQDASSSAEFISGNSPNRKTTYNEPLYISSPGLNTLVVPSGTYTDNIRMTLYGIDFLGLGYSFDTNINFTVQFQIISNLQISLVDEGAVFDPSSTSRVLDFGILTQNAQKGADLRVVSNGPYQIKISSQNNGKLKASSNETINYSFKVNNTSVSLASSSSSPIVIGSGNPTPSSGDRFNLSFQITENVSLKSAGMYQDVLTITAIAN